MRKKSYIFLAALLVIMLSYFIDKNLFMLSRAGGQVWEARGRKDYRIVGKDPMGKQDYLLKGDTLQLLTGKKAGKEFVVMYCVFDNLWIESVDTREVAWYQGR